MPEMTIQIGDEPDGAATAGGPDGLTTQVMAAPGKPDDVQVHVGSGPEAVVPVALFIAVAATYGAKYYFAHRTRQETHKTVRMALERGEPLTPELLDRLGEAPAPKRNDLRRGVVGVCLGIGFAGFGLVLGEPDAVRPMMAVGLVPLLLGAAYLVLWRLSGNKA